MKLMLSVLLFFGALRNSEAQNTYTIQGKILDKMTLEPLEQVLVRSIQTDVKALSNEEGHFSLTTSLKEPGILEISLRDYRTVKMEIAFSGDKKVIDLGLIRLSGLAFQINGNEASNIGEEQLEEGQEHSNLITGMLSASKSLFARTAAYDFSMTFFKPRNLHSGFSTVMLNGVKVNKIFHGRPDWSNWGGLNDALRNQVIYNNASSSPFDIGSLSSSINMISKAASNRSGLKISYAVSNKSYLGRFMTTYSSGLQNSGWAYTFSASVRFADEGFKSGTGYKALSVMASIDKKIGARHFLNTTLIYAYNKRGRSSPMTQEVFELKGATYNSYWGFQEGEKRNSREKRTVEPIFQFNHDFNLNASTRMHNHLTFQFGEVGSSRIDFGGSRWLKETQSIVGGGANPDPAYYQNLPSYFLKNPEAPDYSGAYLATQEFSQNGQIQWRDLYEANRQNSASGNAVYALYEDRHDDTFLSLDSGIQKRFNGRFSFDASFSYAKLKSENYAFMLDLLGSRGYLDVDAYADNWVEAQNNLADQNRIVGKNEKYKYHYELSASRWKGFVRSSYNSRKIESFLAIGFKSTSYLRNGNFENGSFPGNRSLGKSKSISFQGLSLKSGLTYKPSGRHLFLASASYLENPPILKNVFSNVRENNDLVAGLKNKRAFAFDVGYVLRHPLINASLALYYMKLKGLTRISFYYANGLSGLENAGSNAYVQEVLTGIHKNNMGLEFSVEVPFLTGFKFKGVAAAGRFVYSNNPNLYVTSDGFGKAIDMGRAHLKHYFTGGGPQQAYSLGIEYSSPNYWWFGLSLNYFDRAYTDIASISRTKNFLLDTDGQPIHNYDPEVAAILLKQRSFEPYTILNMILGKSWKIKNKYAGFFLSLNNITQTLYKTGGFEQSRNANYNTLLQDKLRDKPLFGPKYWFGYGATFYTSIYVRI